METSLDELTRYRTSSHDVPIVLLDASEELTARLERALGGSVRLHHLGQSETSGAQDASVRKGLVLVEVTPGTPEWNEWLLRHGSMCAQTQVVLLSGETSARATVEAFRGGVADVLVEPIDDVRLRSNLERLMTRRPTRPPESASQRWAAAALAAVKPAEHVVATPEDLLTRALQQLMRLTAAPAGAVLVADDTGTYQSTVRPGTNRRTLRTEEIAIVSRGVSTDAIRFVSLAGEPGHHRWALLTVPVRGFADHDAVLALRVGETTRRRLQFERADLAFFADEVARAWGAAQLQRLIHSAKREYECIVDATTDCLLLLDADFLVRRVNAATTRGLDQPYTSILGRPFDEVFPSVAPRDSSATSLSDFLLRAASTQQPLQLEVTGFLAAGDCHQIHAYPGPQTESGRLTVLFVKDVGEMRQLQRQLIQSEKLASLGTLAAGVAHEINNPVGYVTSNLNRMKEYLLDIGGVLESMRAGLLDDDSVEPEKLRGVIEEIRESWTRKAIDELLEDSDAIFTECFEGLEHVGVIVRNLKQYAASGAPREPDLQLNHVAEGALRLVWNKLKYKVRVEQRLGDTPPIEGSSVELMQVLVNLLVNAADAAEGNQGQVQLETRAEAGGAVVEVQDNGSGIDPAVVDRIFDPFFSTKPPGRGTGLGLAISAEILNRHGARVDVKSAPGEGTTFRIWFPASTLPPVDEDGE